MTIDALCLKMKLSIVLATYNEEQNIKACLDSVKKIADEIIVVDGSSKDRTRLIAKKNGAKVFKVPNRLMFHKNKQLAVEKASCKWILQLDADERVNKDLRFEIEKEINNKNNLYDGYFIPRKNWFLGRFLTKGGQYPDYVIRLFLNGKGRFPAKSVHEQIKIKGRVDYLKHPLIHLADPDFSCYLERFNRYTSLDAVHLYKKNKKPALWFGIQSFLIKPFHWFVLTYFRHKGFVDRFPGFVFALFSSLRFPVTYLKLWEINRKR